MSGLSVATGELMNDPRHTHTVTLKPYWQRRCEAAEALMWHKVGDELAAGQWDKYKAWQALRDEQE